MAPFFFTRMIVEMPLDCAEVDTVCPLALSPATSAVRSSVVLAPSTLVVTLLLVSYVPTLSLGLPRLFGLM